ncbi:MAG: hypothetical protein AB1898_07615 [Acidobacteriota bacterium]
MSLRQYVGQDRAAVLLDANGQLTDKVVLGTSFLTDSWGMTRGNQVVALLNQVTKKEYTRLSGVKKDQVGRYPGRFS